MHFQVQISFGVGIFAEKIGNVYLRAAFQAGAHGTWGGVSTYIQGGNFIHGFTSGALSSSLSSLGKEGGRIILALFLLVSCKSYANTIDPSYFSLSFPAGWDIEHVERQGQLGAKLGDNMRDGRTQALG